MRRLLTALVLASAACAGARSAGPGPHPPAETWPSHPQDASGPIGGRPASPREPAGYPDPDGAPVLRFPSPGGTPGEPSTAGGQRRVLAGRGPAFMAGKSASTAVLPLRGLTWPSDAWASAAGADSMVFATGWTVDRQVATDECRRGGPHTALRLVGVFRVRGEALLVDGRVEQRGAHPCVGVVDARAHLTAFMDDLELYARGVAREGAALPDRG
jgi:hypothetical protein